jgi:hypothetical protein
MTPAAVKATGLKGFMQWLQQDQPGVYAAVAAKIAKAVPTGFSGFNGSVLMSRRLAMGRRSMALRGYGRLGDCSGISSVGTCAAMAIPNLCLDPASCLVTPGIETSCAANSGATSSVDLTGVANIINSVAGAALTAQQNAAYNNLLQTQLSRASTGLTPLVLSSRAAGIPTIGGLTSGSSSSLLLLAGGGVLLYLLFGRRRAA